MYKLTSYGVYKQDENLAIIGPSDNPDWVAYTQWLAEGNTPEPIETIDEIKARKFTEIETACENEITSGFMSSALGTPHRYDSELEDQVNLVGAAQAAALANANVTYNCYENDVKLWLAHTPAQIMQVFMDGVVVKTTLLQKATNLKAAIAAANTIADVTAIEW